VTRTAFKSERKGNPEYDGSDQLSSAYDEARVHAAVESEGLQHLCSLFKSGIWTFH
jgi:hypothetical protein